LTSVCCVHNISQVGSYHEQRVNIIIQNIIIQNIIIQNIIIQNIIIQNIIIQNIIIQNIIIQNELTIHKLISIESSDKLIELEFSELSLLSVHDTKRLGFS
jgi:hypothetical protein